MTEPAEGDGAGRSDAPFLPADRAGKTGLRRPTGPEIRDALYVPGSESEGATPAGGFDARALVEAQKNQSHRPKPAYGTLPAATWASRMAAEELRVEARRRRRRNRALGRIFMLTVLGGLGAAAWFGYQTFRTDQQQAADSEQSTDDAGDDAGDDVASLSPTPTQAPATPDSSSGVPPPAAASVEQLTDPFGARSVEFLFRRWESAAAGSPMAEYFYRYDRVDDIHIGEVRRDGAVTIVGTDTEYHYAVATDGTIERVRRNAASLDLAPDVALANVFRESDVLPETARAFAVLENTTLGPGFGDAHSYTLDTEQWRVSDPGSYSVWVSRWNSRPANDTSLLEAGTRETSPDPFDVATYPAPPSSEPTEPTADGLERAEAGASVTYLVAPAGHVLVVTIVDNTADFRIEYYLTDVGDLVELPGFADRTWSPAT